MAAPGLISDVNQLLHFLLDFLIPNGGDAELDEVLQLTRSTSWTAPPSQYDPTPCYYYGTSVWHGYISQAAVGIIKLPKTQNSFGIGGSGIVAVIDNGVLVGFAGSSCL